MAGQLLRSRSFPLRQNIQRLRRSVARCRVESLERRQLLSSSLPSPWTASSLGAPSKSGSAAYKSGLFTISGAGSAIGGTGDQGEFAWVSLSGNATITAKVNSEQNTNSLADAGVMIRASLAGNATFAGMFITPGNGTLFADRASTGASATLTYGNAGATAPLWLRLVRGGSTLVGYDSSDGIHWVQVGTVSISMASSVDLGLAVSSHNASALNKSVFGNVTVLNAIPALAAPASVTATAYANDPRILLQWTSSDTTTTGFTIERSTNGVSYSPIATVAANVSSYTDLGLNAATTYFYEVVAVNSLTSSAPSAAVSASTASFQVLDTLLYNQKPNLASTGLHEYVYLSNEGQFFAPDQEYIREIPDQTATQNTADAAVAAGDSIFIIDIEGWSVDIRSTPLSQVQTDISKFLEVIGWLRAAQPSLKIGIYDELPVYGNSPATPAPDQALLALGQAVDFVCPDLYTIPLDATQWVTMAVNELKEATLFGKPVYPFLWMNYESDLGDGMNYAYLPASYWELELQTVRRYANGAVLWGGWNQATDSPATWDPTLAWWQVTQPFLNTTAPDAPALAAPSGLTATPGMGQIQLSWTNHSSAPDGVTLERSTDDVNFIPLAMLPGNATSYTDTALYGGPYYYQVVASSWTADSAPSNVVSATAFQEATAQFVPADFNADNQVGEIVNDGTIGGLGNGSWTEYGGVDFGAGMTSFAASLSTTQTGMAIQLHLDSLTGPVVGTLNVANTGSWDTSLTQAASISEISGIHNLYLTYTGPLQLAWFTFGNGSAPTAPTNLSVAVNAPGSTRLQWSDGANDETGFSIERSTDGVNFTQTAAVAAGNFTYTDTPYGGSTYYYQVCAYSQTGGASAWSNVTSCTPRRNAFAPLSAVTPDTYSGVAEFTGSYIGGLGNGSWLAYDNVNFGNGASTFEANLALPPSLAGETISVYLGSLNGPLISALTMASTGSWDNFVTQTAAVSGVIGVHNIYIVFSGPVNVSYFQFA